MRRPYEPVPCSFHDRLLAAATLRHQCTLTVEEADGGVHDVRERIEDVYTRGGAEYLRLQDGRVYRLDSVRALDGEPPGED